MSWVQLANPQPPAGGLLLQLAWRNLWRHPKRTLITLSAIAIGFALAVISIGIGDGSHNAMIRNAILLGEGHLTLQVNGYSEAPSNHLFIHQGQYWLDRLNHEQKAANHPKTLAPFVAVPRISLQLLASSASHSVAVGLQGVADTPLRNNTPHFDPRAAKLKSKLIEGEWLNAAQLNGVVIGQGMAQKLKLKLGSKLVLMAATQQGDTQTQLARVRGIFNSGLSELDDYLLLSHLDFARLFLLADQSDSLPHDLQRPLTNIALFLSQPEQMTQWQQQIQPLLHNTPLVLQDWPSLMPELMQFIALDDAGNYVFLSLILVLVLFGIINTMLMSLLERTREFGLLRALGLSRWQLMGLVSLEVVLLSVLALTLGWLVGGSAHYWLSHHGLNLAAMMDNNTAIMGTYMDAVIYSELSVTRVIQLSVGIVLATLLSGLYPAFKASRVMPIAALKR